MALFNDSFLNNVHDLVELHHRLYPRIPPQGIYFESLVGQAFKKAGWPADQVIPTSPNSPMHDLMVGNTKLSLKTETGKITRPNHIAITKLCTTETGDWELHALIRHVLEHLSRYERMLMLRAIWRKPAGLFYQLIEIPLTLLRRIEHLEAAQVGNRSGRRSIGGDVLNDKGEVLFHVHFDGADGKCQIRRLPVADCNLLLGWNKRL